MTTQKYYEDPENFEDPETNRDAVEGIFLRACEHGELEEVSSLINAGRVDIDVAYMSFGVERGGKTGLMLASQHGHFAVVRFLLAAGADQHIEGEECNNFSSALMLAAQHGQVDIVHLLLNKGANARSITGALDSVVDNLWNSTDFWGCTFGGLIGYPYLYFIKLFLDHGADASEKTRDNYCVFGEESRDHTIFSLVKGAKIRLPNDGQLICRYMVAHALKDNKEEAARKMLNSISDEDRKDIFGSADMECIINNMDVQHQEIRKFFDLNAALSTLHQGEGYRHFDTVYNNFCASATHLSTPLAETPVANVKNTPHLPVELVQYAISFSHDIPFSVLSKMHDYVVLEKETDANGGIVYVTRRRAAIGDPNLCRVLGEELTTVMLLCGNDFSKLQGDRFLQQAMAVSLKIHHKSSEDQAFFIRTVQQVVDNVIAQVNNVIEQGVAAEETTQLENGRASLEVLNSIVKESGLSQFMHLISFNENAVEPVVEDSNWTVRVVTKNASRGLP